MGKPQNMVDVDRLYFQLKNNMVLHLDNQIFGWIIHITIVCNTSVLD